MSTRRIAFMILITLLAFASLGLDAKKPQAGTYLVDSNGDAADANPGDGVCDVGGWLSQCTLHAAIQEANLDGGASTINFAAPMDIGYPSLPSITGGNTTIDASNQWNGTWPGGRPGVSIGGVGYWNGLLNIQADGATVRGIEFQGSSSVGIFIGGSSGSNTIGDEGEGQRNVFLGGTGVRIQSSRFGTLIQSNYFGTWDGENAVPSDIGVFLEGGGGNFVEGNLIVGNRNSGVYILRSENNFIQHDNIIGANKRKNAALPNSAGVSIIDGDNNVVWDNFIAGNDSHGVELQMADYNAVISNVIGDQFSVGNGGDGIHAFNSNHNKFGGDLDGNLINQNGGYGIWLEGSSNLIQGNSIDGNALDGIFLGYGQENQIGGAGVLKNVISKNGGSGVRFTGTGTTNNTLVGNHIGLSSGAFDAGNQAHGVLVDAGASMNRVGGLNAGEGNWIGWNTWTGVYISGADTQGNKIEGNVIGAPINWEWQAPNGHHGIGVYDGAHDNQIGSGNTIIASDWSGIAIVNSNDNTVWFNSIGTNGADVNWGNNYYGVAVVNSVGNLISSNEIAFNGGNGGQAGVLVDGGLAGNRITINSIHDNGGAGIELTNGGNFELGAPSITGASCQGPITGTACPGCRIEIFSDAGDEGQFYEGTTTADAVSGDFSWNGIANGPNVTATATGGVGNTSPFSTPESIGACNSPPTAAFSIDPTTGTPATVFDFDASASHDAEDPASAIEVRWDWEDDGAYDTSWSADKTTAHSFNIFGLITIRLQVRDSAGLADAVTEQVSIVEETASYGLFLPAVVR